MDPKTPDRGSNEGLSEVEISYLKLLESLKAAAQHGASDLGVVQRIAAWIEAESVLDFICLHQRWYDDWEIKEALLRNDQTPREIRGELEKQIAIFDLLRELDAPELTEQETAEIQEDVRSLFQTLNSHDRGVVRARAYQLSSSRQAESEPAPAAPPSLLPPLEDGEVPAAESDRRGPELEDLFEGQPEAAPEPSRAPVAPVEPPAPAPSEPAPPAPSAPEPLPVETAPQPPIPEGPALEAPVLEPPVSEVAPATPAPPEPETPAQAPSPRVEDQPRAPSEDHRREVELATSTDDLALLRILAGDNDEEIQLAALANPLLNEELAGAMARRAGTRVAQALYRDRTLFSRPAVRRGLLECPSAPAAAQLEIVGTLGQLGDLLKVLSSPKVRHLEVKAKARSSLQMRFRAMGGGEKVAAVRRHGRPLLKQLWTDFFRDETLVLRCLEQRQLDGATVLEIARSKIAPRRALEVIGTQPAWTAQYAVRLALVQNPKTPRQVASKLVRTLSPADRRALKSNPSVAEAVRRQA